MSEASMLHPHGQTTRVFSALRFACDTPVAASVGIMPYLPPSAAPAPQDRASLQITNQRIAALKDQIARLSAEHQELEARFAQVCPRLASVACRSVPLLNPFC